jgi:hypothetical protein
MKIEWIGRRFGRLVCLEKPIKNKAVDYIDYRVRCKCDCGKEKIFRVNHLNRGATQSCGCLRKEISGRKGLESPSWKGGRNKNSNGYITLTRAIFPGHEKYARNQVPEHIVVMARYLGRALLPGETVHHKNGIRDDNRLENLELWACNHSYGQRVSDLIPWAEEILRRYKPEALK